MTIVKREKKREENLPFFPDLLIRSLSFNVFNIFMEFVFNEKRTIKNVSRKVFFVYVAYVIKARNELLRDFCKRVIIVGLHNSTSGASNETNQ